MENNEEVFDILSFDASQLAINNQPDSKSQGNSNIYKPRPADSKSEDGIYRAQIKVIYNPFDFRQSVLEQQSYGLQDKDGFFSVISSLTVNDTNCPIFKAWKTCHYSKNQVLFNQQAPVKEGGKGLFDKRFARYVTIQVMEDINNPDLNGKYMLWKMPKAVWEVINAKQSPTNPAKASIPVMDFLFGRAIDIEVKPGPGKVGDERYTRETSYTCELSDDPVSCTNPDGSSLLNDEQLKVLEEYIEDMKAVWKEKDPVKRSTINLEIFQKENTKKLKAFYKEIIEKIKTFCPNLIESLGYKPWTQEVTDRVNNWIKIVLQGNDPTSLIDSTTTQAAEQLQDPVKTNTQEVNTPNVSSGSEDDDLPF